MMMMMIMKSGEQYPALFTFIDERLNFIKICALAKSSQALDA